MILHVRQPHRELVTRSTTKTRDTAVRVIHGREENNFFYYFHTDDE